MHGYKQLITAEWHFPWGNVQISESLQRKPSVAHEPWRRTLKEPTQYTFRSARIYISGIARQNLRNYAKKATELTEYDGWRELRQWDHSSIFAFKSEKSLEYFEALEFFEAAEPP